MPAVAFVLAVALAAPAVFALYVVVDAWAEDRAARRPPYPPRYSCLPPEGAD